MGLASLHLGLRNGLAWRFAKLPVMTCVRVTMLWVEPAGFF